MKKENIKNIIINFRNNIFKDEFNEVGHRILIIFNEMNNDLDILDTKSFIQKLLFFILDIDTLTDIQKDSIINNSSIKLNYSELDIDIIKCFSETLVIDLENNLTYII